MNLPRLDFSPTKPFWMFWHPGSGLTGGMIMGLALTAIIVLLLNGCHIG